MLYMLMNINYGYLLMLLCQRFCNMCINYYFFLQFVCLFKYMLSMKIHNFTCILNWTSFSSLYHISFYF